MHGYAAAAIALLRARALGREFRSDGQRSAAWHAARAKRATASVFAYFLGLCPQRCWRVRDYFDFRVNFPNFRFSSAPANFGTVTEAPLRDAYAAALCAHTGARITVREPEFYAGDGAHAWLGASPDGEIYRDGAATGVLLELKSPCHVPHLTDVYMWQLVLQMAMTGWHEADFLSVAIPRVFAARRAWDAALAAGADPAPAIADMRRAIVHRRATFSAELWAFAEPRARATHRAIFETQDPADLPPDLPREQWPDVARALQVREHPAFADAHVLRVFADTLVREVRATVSDERWLAWYGLGESFITDEGFDEVPGTPAPCDCFLLGACGCDAYMHAGART